MFMYLSSFGSSFTTSQTGQNDTTYIMPHHQCCTAEKHDVAIFLAIIHIIPRRSWLSFVNGLPMGRI